jgi:anti-sigma B factor antagonist
MEIATETLESGALLIRLNGRIDMAGAGSIGLPFTAALSNCTTPVIVDLSGVTYLASIGIRTFIMSAKALHNRGGKMILAAPSPEVRSVLDTVGVTDMLATKENVEEAAAYAATL